MRIRKHIPTIFALSAMMSLGAALYVNLETTHNEVVAATNQVLENFAPYTYSGSYYTDKEIDFNAGDGMDGALRTTLSTKIRPAGFVEYSEGLSEHLQEADEDPDNPNNMVMFYTRNSITKTPANNGGMIWNREHVWPKNKSNGNWGTTKGGTDILHLRPTYETPNSTRSNHPYGNAHSGSKKTYNGMDYGWLDGDIFEPLDCVKGDAARIIMYVWTAYTGYSGYSPLSITSVFESFDTLLTWHTMDKPDMLEGHRNDYVQNETIQKNRNPFVDHPELAWKIFGDNASASVKEACMAAYPASGGTHIDPTGITLDKATASVEAGKTIQLKASLQPSGATGSITWSSTNSSIASVNSSGKVTGVSTGTTVIKATYSSFSASCTVTVTEPLPTNYGTIDNPISVAEAKAIIDNESPTAQKMYVKGIVTSNTFNSQYSNFDDVYLTDGVNGNALNVFRSVLADGIDTSYNATGSLVDKEIIACGYGQLYNGTKYELAKQNNYVPTILSIKDPGVTEKTPQELIEEMTTSTSLSYRFAKTTSGNSSVTDTLTRESSGIASGTTSYTEWTHTDSTSGISYTGQSAANYDSIQLRSDNNNSGVVVSANPNGTTASTITVTWNSNTSNGRVLNVYGKSTAYSKPTDLYDSNKQGTLLGTIVKGTSTSLTITGSYAFIGFRSNNKAMYLDEVQIVWGGASSASYEYYDTNIRFGGNLTQELWNDLNDESMIEGFGVMITANSEIAQINNSYADAIPDENNPDVNEKIVDYYIPVEQKDAIIGSTEDNYFWNLRYSVTDLKQEYTAAAYVKTEDGYVFFKQVTYSAKTLADDYIKNRGLSTTIADGSLNNLANLKENN